MNIDSNLGLTKNPFSKKSAEQELEFLHEIFYQPVYYKTLQDVLKNGDSRFIIGQRGHGKTLIINKLYEDLESGKYFIIKIDRFEGIPIKKNETALIKQILRLSVTKISIFLEKNKHLLKNLSNIEKEKLSLFIQLFFRSISRNEYEKIFNSIKKVKNKNRFIRFINYFGIGVANKTISALVSVTSDTINQSLGINNVTSEGINKMYFGKLNEIDFEKIDLDKQNFSKEELKHFLDEFLILIKKLDFINTIILFDKIDEYQELNQDISKISNFTSEILTDTELLMNEQIAMGFSLWSELKSELDGVVRFDKFGIIDVRWKDEDMIPLLNKRLKHYSINKITPVTIEKLMPNGFDRTELVNLAYKSPRDLISVLSEIYSMQSSTNQSVSAFDDSCISKGFRTFCLNYDYDSITPSKTGKNKEIKAMINRILTVKLPRFTSKNLTDTYNQNSSQSEGQIKVMQQYKLIQEDDIMGTNGEKYFEVIDPKVLFMLKRGVSKIE